MRMLSIIMLIVGLTVSASQRYFGNISEMGEYGDLTVNRIYASPGSYVWLATDRGVLRVDGVHALMVRVADAERPLFITSFAELDNGNIIVGTRKGLVSIDRMGRIVWRAGDDEEVTSLVKCGGDTILAGSSHGLMAYDSSGALLELPGLPVANPYSPQAHILTMAADDSGNTYIHTLRSLYERNSRGEFRKIYSNSVWNDNVADMMWADGKLWVAVMSAGLWVVDPRTGEAQQVDVNSPVITSVTSGDGKIYVGTDGSGVKVVNPHAMAVEETLAYHSGRMGSMASNQIYSLAKMAGDGPLLIGYYQHGADYTVMNGNTFSVYDRKGRFDSRDVAIRTITARDDYLALGTREGLVILWRDGRINRISRPALKSDMVIAVEEYRGKLYIGTYGGGLSVYNLESGRLEEFAGVREWEYPFVSGHVFSLAVDRDDMLWIGTGNGLFRYDGDKLVSRYTDESRNMPEGNIYEISFDSQGRGWICAEGGVTVFDINSGRLRNDLIMDDELRNDKIRSVFEAHDGTLFFVPERGRVVMADGDLKKFDHLSIPALDGVDVKAIAEDRHGYMWVATNHGMYRWNREDDDIIKFGVSSGLPSQQFLLCKPVVTRDGELLFGNSSGLIKVHSDADSGMELLSGRPVPTNAVAAGDGNTLAEIVEIDSAKYEIRLDRFSSNLMIEISPFTFTPLDVVTYQYSRDDGRTWQPLSTNMGIELYNSFATRHENIIVRPEGDMSRAVDIAVSMPMSLAMKAIVVLCVLAAGLILYIMYLTARRVGRHVLRVRKKDAAEAVDVDANETENRPKYRSNPLNDDECHRIMKLVTGVMEKEKLYVDPDLKITRLAQSAGISSHRLSQVFSQHLGIKFYDYVNKFRVNEFKRIATHGGASRYTLSAMAEKAGFSSRASFFRHFKEIEGVSPGEFLQRIKDK